MLYRKGQATSCASSSKKSEIIVVLTYQSETPYIDWTLDNMQRMYGIKYDLN